VSTSDRLDVFVYRGSRREGVYLYLPGEGAFGEVPAPLLEAMGKLELVMELELYPGRTMARETAETVMRNVRVKGYHLQLPPVDTPGSSRLQ
jgi:uncharacterized protein YcgL (UPF0745 family)